MDIISDYRINALLVSPVITTGSPVTIPAN